MGDRIAVAIDMLVKIGLLRAPGDLGISEAERNKHVRDVLDCAFPPPVVTVPANPGRLVDDEGVCPSGPEGGEHCSHSEAQRHCDISVPCCYCGRD